MTACPFRGPCWTGLLLALTLACGRKEAPKAVPPPPPPAPPAPKPAPKPYEARVLTDPKALQALRDGLGPARFAEVLKLNRLDLGHAIKGTTLVVPTQPGDFLTHSPFPAQVEGLQDQPKILLVSLRVQAWAAYEAGTLVRWGPTSTGKAATPTPPGLFHTNWRYKERLSSFNREWVLRWYVNIHNASGVSFHEYELPGRPDSHSCIRLAADDAEWIYPWCGTWTLSQDQRTVLKEGTPVVIFGAYAWKEPRPWTRLAEDPRACNLGPQDLEEALRILRERVAPVFAKQ